MKTTEQLDTVANEVREVLKKHDVAGAFAIATQNSGVSGGYLDTTWSHTTTGVGSIEVKCNSFTELCDVVTFLIGLQRMLEDKADHIGESVKCITDKFPPGASLDHAVQRMR